MFTENKISRIFEIVKNIKYDEYLIWNKAIITQDLKSRPLKKPELKHIYNSSSIVLNIKDKNKLIDYLRKIYYAVDRALLCYFKEKIIKLNDSLTYYRRFGENTSIRFSRQMLEMNLQDFQYIYEKTKCKNIVDRIVNFKIKLNIIYNANYKISLKEYIECLLLFNEDYIKRLSVVILYKLFRNYLKKYYLKTYTFTDLNVQDE